jgi:hypothetical protein
MSADGIRALASKLLPRPHAIDGSGPARAVPRHFAIRASPDVDVEHATRAARSRFESIGCTLDIGTAASTDAIPLALARKRSIDEQSYRLRSSPREIVIEGGGDAGIAYGVTTLAQIVEACAAEHAPLPSLTIEDRPDFPRRGFMLDISRSKVPTLATLFDLVDWMAYLKLNELQLYTEHTFAYRDHESVWSDASPLTAAEIRALDRHCRERHVELVPNQQSFGHMHRWLKHERYRSLAEVPEGIVHAFSREREPYGLCATDPESLAFLESLYDELLPNFSSSRFNVGLDEPVDLGLGRSRAACADRGTDRVYLDFARAVAELVRARGARMEMWADIVVKDPSLAREIPGDVHLLEWGYDADHPFRDHLALLAGSGHSFSVCPGTSSWQSIAGRTHNALANLRSAAVHGKAAGAVGYLITDWGDRGHLQPLSASYAGIVAGAACAWNAESGASADFDLASALDRHAFRDEARVLGGIVTRLGDVYRTTGAASTNGSALFFLLAFADEPLPHARMPGLSATALHATRESIRSLRAELERSRPVGADSLLCVDEMRWAADLLAFACRFGIARLDSPADASVRGDLRAELAPLIAGHERLWIARNRPGGRAESASWLTRVADRL